MITPPSIYEYRSEREWEAAMAEWCAENEDTAARTEYIAIVTALPPYNPCWRMLSEHTTLRFATAAERAEWLAAHPEAHLIPGGLTEEVANISRILRPRNAKQLPGGTLSEYRELGLIR